MRKVIVPLIARPNTVANSIDNSIGLDWKSTRAFLPMPHQHCVIVTLSHELWEKVNIGDEFNGCLGDASMVGKIVAKNKPSLSGAHTITVEL